MYQRTGGSRGTGRNTKFISKTQSQESTNSFATPSTSIRTPVSTRHQHKLAQNTTKIVNPGVFSFAKNAEDITRHRKTTAYKLIYNERDGVRKTINQRETQDRDAKSRIDEFSALSGVSALTLSQSTTGGFPLSENAYPYRGSSDRNLLQPESMTTSRIKNIRHSSSAPSAPGKFVRSGSGMGGKTSSRSRPSFQPAFGSSVSRPSPRLAAAASSAGTRPGDASSMSSGRGNTGAASYPSSSHNRNSKGNSGNGSLTSLQLQNQMVGSSSLSHRSREETNDEAAHTKVIVPQEAVGSATDRIDDRAVGSHRNKVGAVHFSTATTSSSAAATTSEENNNNDGRACTTRTSRIQAAPMVGTPQQQHTAAGFFQKEKQVEDIPVVTKAKKLEALLIEKRRILAEKTAAAEKVFTKSAHNIECL